MVPEGTLLHSQMTATCPYPQPDLSRPSYALKIHFNIPSTLKSSKCSLSLRYPHQNPVRTSFVSLMCQVSRPSHTTYMQEETK